MFKCRNPQCVSVVCTVNFLALLYLQVNELDERGLKDLCVPEVECHLSFAE